MTREEAILCLKGMKKYGRDTFTEQTDWQESLDMAIKALEQEPCEDVVSRQAVFETIDDCNSDGLKGIFCSYDDGERFKKYIKNLPSVTPTRKEWIPVVERLPEDGEKILMNTVHFGVITGIYDSEPGFMAHYSLSSADMASVEVIAWMPLPEPYKAESEDKE